MADYKSEFTGAQIDDGIKKARSALQPTGATMTGPLVLSGDPASAKEAATKEYVDNHSADNVVQYVEQTLTTDQQAVARTNIGAAREAEYELIETITLEEEVETIEFNSLSLKAAYVEIYTPAAAASANCGLYIKQNQRNIYMGISGLINTTERFAKVRVEAKEGLTVITGSNPASKKENTAGVAGYGVYVWDEPITIIRYTSGSGNVFPIGTNVDIWGVRA